MRSLLVQQDLLKALSGKDKFPESTSKDEKEELEMKAHSVIQFCLVDEVLREIVDDTACRFVAQIRELIYD